MREKKKVLQLARSVIKGCGSVKRHVTVHICTYIYVYISLCVYIYIYIYICIYMCVCLCMCTNIYTWIYTITAEIILKKERISLHQRNIISELRVLMLTFRRSVLKRQLELILLPFLSLLHICIQDKQEYQVIDGHLCQHLRWKCLL